MSRRVRSLGAVLLTLSLVLNVPTAFAAVRDRDAGFHPPSFVQRVVRAIQKVLKPLMPANNNDDEFKPSPPLP